MKKANRCAGWLLWLIILEYFCVSTVWAQEGAANVIDSGDTAWILVSSAFVLCMTLPGLALFYGGLVRSKNVLGTIMHAAIILCVTSIVWVLWGYTLAFGPDVGGIIGGLDHLGLIGVGPEAFPGTRIPHLVFMVFQLMFAAITVALVTGSFAERMKFKALLLFAVLWSTFVYSPLTHWVWGGGWMAQMGFLDFAGGAVVHISSGFGALVCAILVGKRKGLGVEAMPPHNLPMTVLGAGLLWFGWFGLNAGSALGANDVAASAFVATHIAACAGGLSWMVVEWINQGKPTVLGVASGIISGLTTITAGAGFLGPFSALFLGLLAGFVCYVAVIWKSRLGYDDSLDVVGIHGVGGFIGILATGLFASIGAQGLFFGNTSQFLVQAGLAIATLVFTLVGTFVILKIVDMTIGLRVSVEDETMGLDLSQHNERAYS